MGGRPTGSHRSPRRASNPASTPNFRTVFKPANLDEIHAAADTIDTSKMSEKALDEWRRGAKRGPAKLLLQYLDAQGIQLGRDPVKIGLTEPILYNGGVTGCWIDGQARTNVTGLYALGDVASGTAIRGINGAICAGWRAGANGARVAAEFGARNIDVEAVARERERVLAPSTGGAASGQRNWKGNSTT